MVDLAVKITGMTFKNPVLLAASELVFNGDSTNKEENHSGWAGVSPSIDKGGDGLKKTIIRSSNAGSNG